MSPASSSGSWTLSATRAPRVSIAHSFDVVIAANVLHATRSLRESLTHVRRLMAPGGKLVVLEGTRRVRWLDLTFGMTSGWWRFDDTELRADHPLLSIDAWRRLLDELGWEAIRVIPPFPMSCHDREPESAVILSQVDERLPHDNTVSPNGEATRWVLLADDHGYGDALATHLQRVLHQPCVSVHLADLMAVRDTSATPGGVAAPAGRDSLAPLWASALPPTDVVFLGSLAPAGREHMLVSDAGRLGETLLHVVQSMAATLDGGTHRGARGDARMRFWVVTRGAQLCAATTDGLTQASVWGFVRTLALEYPHWDCRLIDLDPAAPPSVASRVLLDEVAGCARDNEPEVAFRDGLRRVRRLVSDPTRE